MTCYDFVSVADDHFDFFSVGDLAVTIRYFQPTTRLA